MEKINNQFEKREIFRRNIFNRPNLKIQNNLTQNLKRYNDHQTLDENVLKEMATAYAGVLSKYGYSVQQNRVEQGDKAEQENKTVLENKMEQSRMKVGELNQSSYSDISNTANQISKQRNIQQNEVNNVYKSAGEKSSFNDNLDYLPNNYLFAEQNNINNQLQLTNNLLTQILNELRVVSCLVERNRRHRLS